MKLWITWTAWEDFSGIEYAPQIFTEPVENALEIDSSVFAKKGSNCLFDYETFKKFVREQENEEEARRQAEQDEQLKIAKEKHLKDIKEVQIRSKAYQEEKQAEYAKHSKKHYKKIRLVLKEKYNL